MKKAKDGGYPRRWRFFECFQYRPYNSEEETAARQDAERLIEEIRSKEFEAKIWAPRREHSISGHVHVVVLCTIHEMLALGGLPEYAHLLKGASKRLKGQRRESGSFRNTHPLFNGPHEESRLATSFKEASE